MACDTFEALRVLSESLGEHIARRASHKSIWLNAMPRGTYKNGTGLTQTTFTVENTEPYTTEEAWNDISLSQSSLVPGSDTVTAGSASTQGACAITWNDVTTGFTERQYSLKKFGLRGDVICADDLTFAWQAQSFLAAYQQELAKRAQRTWELKYFNEYVNLVPKVVTTGDAASPTIATDTTEGLPNASNMSLADSTVELTQGALDQVAVDLIEGGATEGDSSGWITLGAEGPVFPMLIGMEASAALAKNNDKLREDLHFGEPNALLKRMGASRILGSMRHVVTTQPARYSYSGGQYTRVAPYVEANASKGKKAVPNPDYASKTTAPYEAAVILNPAVFTAEVVKPVNSAAGMKWNPKTYSGDWKFIVGGDIICDQNDPTGRLGRHFAEYACAIRPVRPEDGRVIIFKR
jgi:hypothetical protein